MSYYRRYSFFIHKFSNAAKVVNKRIPRGFSLPNVHYAQLDNIANGLQTIFCKLELGDELSLERIKSEFLGKKEDVDTLMQLFNKHNTDVAKQVGISLTSATLQKYNVCKLHFSDFLRTNYEAFRTYFCRYLRFWSLSSYNYRACTLSNKSAQFALKLS